MGKRTLDLGRETSLREPIEIIDGDKTYTVVDLTDEVINEIDALSDEDLPLGELLNRQLSLYLGQRPETFAHLEIREKTAIKNFIAQELSDPLGNRQQRRAARR